MRELLLLLCQYPYKEKNRDSLSKLISEVKDWRKLVELINAHGIIALAAYNIKEAGLVKDVPADAMASLENGYKQSMVRNLWLAERWKEVNTILCNAGIKHVLLKGMALEHTLYGSKGLRQMTDNDILIKKEDSIKAWNILKQNGYLPAIIKSGLHKKIIFEIGKHLPALYKDGYAVEIHYKLSEADNGEIASHEIDNAVEYLIGNTKANMLTEKVHLEYLIHHFRKHARGGIIQFRSYADILLIDEKCPVSVPDEFVENPVQDTKQIYLKAAFKETVGSLPPDYRLRFIIGDIFPSLTWMKRRYKCDGAKAFLYYPQRIGKLLWLI
jgi:hypothetical protein